MSTPYREPAMPVTLADFAERDRIERDRARARLRTFAVIVWTVIVTVGLTSLGTFVCTNLNAPPPPPPVHAPWCSERARVTPMLMDVQLSDYFCQNGTVHAQVTPLEHGGAIVVFECHCPVSHQ